MTEKTKVIQCSLKDGEVTTFESAFSKSGMRNEAEFIRYLVAQYDRSTTFYEAKK